ncbi:MAG: Dyp-type peroxidase [Chloroflexi bacterium]|nr:Dyp-type peroxidase [Chloroflexota bacterium]
MSDPQAAINAPQTRDAIFLVLALTPGTAHAEQTRRVLGQLDALVRAVGARDIDCNLSLAVAFGSAAWDSLFGQPRPADLHPFRELRAGNRVAPSTPGDMLFHIRAERFDVCFELAAQIVARLADSATTVDETHGFRYFDDRDLTGFVDGTENPTGTESIEATIVGDEDPAFAGGSYVMVQKYLHNITAWNRLPTETQEGIIGRTKLNDIELDDTVKPTYAHNALTTLVENGNEVKILRHNMPFGQATIGDSGTYFIGYARSLHPLETMLENMVLGVPPGNYDHLLDFTHPVTGTNFFAPSVQFLSGLANGQPVQLLPPASAPAQARTSPDRAGTLSIGSLKGVPQHE